MKKQFGLLALLCTTGAFAQTAPKNVIYMIGDGMGPAFTTAYRYYKDDPTTKEIETTVFDTMLKGMAHTAQQVQLHLAAAIKVIMAQSLSIRPKNRLKPC